VGLSKISNFLVNPDQLSALMIGAQYNSSPDDTPPVIAPFGSGCSLLLLSMISLSAGICRTTDIAMREYILLIFSLLR